MLFSCQAAVWLSFHAKASLEYHKLFLMSRTNSKSFKHPYVQTKDLLSARIFPQISRRKKSLACEALAPSAAASATCFFARDHEACLVQCALRYHFSRLLCGPLDQPPSGGFLLNRKSHFSKLSKKTAAATSCQLLLFFQILICISTVLSEKMTLYALHPDMGNTA